MSSPFNDGSQKSFCSDVYENGDFEDTEQSIEELEALKGKIRIYQNKIE